MTKEKSVRKEPEAVKKSVKDKKLAKIAKQEENTKWRAHEELYL